MTDAITTLNEELRGAYDASVPLAHVTTPDSTGAQDRAVRTLIEVEPGVQIFAHSALAGIEALTNSAGADLGAMTGGQDPAMFSDPATLLRALISLPVSTDASPAPSRVLIWWGADRSWSDPGLADALLMCRDRFSARNVSLLGLGEGRVTGRLAAHVHPITDPLPTDEEREKIARDHMDTNGITYSKGELRACVNGTRGLIDFATRQVVALGTWRGFVDAQAIARRWREQLSGLPGVSVVAPMPLEWFGGSEAWMRELQEYVPAAPSLVVLFDEIEKLVSKPGQARDGGASDAVLGAALAYLNDSEPAGAIAEGVAGTGKTMSALVAGSVFQCPIIRLNPGRMLGGIVGESQANADRAFSTIGAFGGLQLWIATSNDLSTVPDELGDRFPGGVYFFDLPTLAELILIWRGNLIRYGFDSCLAEKLAVYGWTGRDVRAVCLEARRKPQLRIEDIAARRIPAGRKMATRIERMRSDAVTNSYKSAATGLPYAGPQAPLPVSAAAARIMRRPAAPTPPATPAAAAGEDMF